MIIIWTEGVVCHKSKMEEGKRAVTSLELNLVSPLRTADKGHGPERRHEDKRPASEGSLKATDPYIVTEQDIRREKDKARQLRRSVWWMRKTREGLCYYCNRKLDRNELTMDHVVPISRGGKSKKGNIVPACKECNNKKKQLLPVEWEEYLKGLSESSPSG